MLMRDECISKRTLSPRMILSNMTNAMNIKGDVITRWSMRSKCRISLYLLMTLIPDGRESRGFFGEEFCTTRFSLRVALKALRESPDAITEIWINETHRLSLRGKYVFAALRNSRERWNKAERYMRAICICVSKYRSCKSPRGELVFLRSQNKLADALRE